MCALIFSNSVWVWNLPDSWVLCPRQGKDPAFELYYLSPLACAENSWVFTHLWPKHRMTVIGSSKLRSWPAPEYEKTSHSHMVPMGSRMNEIESLQKGKRLVEMEAVRVQNGKSSKQATNKISELVQVCVQPAVIRKLIHAIYIWSEIVSTR